MLTRVSSEDVRFLHRRATLPSSIYPSRDARRARSGYSDALLCVPPSMLADATHARAGVHPLAFVRRISLSYARRACGEVRFRPRVRLLAERGVRVRTWSPALWFLQARS